MVKFAVREWVLKAPFSSTFRKEGVCWAFLSVVREAATACGSRELRLAGSFPEKVQAKAAAEDVQLRERHVARLAAGEGFALRLAVGQVQPALVAV